MMSPHADGPLRFIPTTDGQSASLIKMTKFGRSFSVVRVPFAFKLLLQELQAMNIHMKIITAGNVNNLLTMNYSDNINKLMRNDDSDLNNLMKQVNDELKGAMRYKEQVLPAERLRPEPVEPPVPERDDDDDDSIPYAHSDDDSIPYFPGNDDSSEAYVPGSDGADSIPYAPSSDSIPYAPSSDSVPFAPLEGVRPPSPTSMPPPPGSMVPLSDDEFLPEPVSNDDLPKVATKNELEMKNPYIQAQFDALGSKDKMKLVEAVAQVESERVEKVSAATASAVPVPIVVNTPTIQMTQDTMGILKVDEPPTKSDDDDDEKSDDEKSGGGVKKVAFS